MKLEKFRAKVIEKAEALVQLVVGVQPYYLSTSEKNKRFIETTIGAAIWYLPKSKQILFTGMISKDAIQKGEKSEEHLYPRKIAAEDILKTNWGELHDPSTHLADQFIKKYGRYNYVSKAENRKLIQFQKSCVFESSSEAYNAAGILLIPHP